MQRLMDIVGGAAPVSISAAPGQRASNPMSDPNVAQMRGILERFYHAAEQSIGKVVREAPHDRPLREALLTEPVADGVRMGEWEIRAIGEGKRRAYDVVRCGESTPLVAELALYEVAFGLVRLLNEGKALNTSPVLALLHEERRYHGALSEAIRLRQRLAQADLPAPRRTIFSARYDAAKQQALAARAQITNLVETLPWA